MFDLAVARERLGIVRRVYRHSVNCARGPVVRRVHPALFLVIVMALIAAGCGGEAAAAGRTAIFGYAPLGAQATLVELLLQPPHRT